MTDKSLSELARDLARIRPAHPAADHISNLIQQCGNYHRNPVTLRPMMLATMQRIEEA